jgi:hypothetical protein
LFEFPFDLNGQTVNMTVTSVAGHLTSQDFSQAFKSWNSCNPSALFAAPIDTFISKVKKIWIFFFLSLVVLTINTIFFVCVEYGSFRNTIKR